MSDPLQVAPNAGELVPPTAYASSSWRPPARVTLLCLTFLSCAISYLDRVNLSIAAPVIIAERGLDEARMGVILGAFFWGFALAHPVGGWLADRFGGKRVLAAGAAWWSLWTALTPLGWPSLYAARVMLGAGEGVNTPAIQSLVGRWFPVHERSRAVALNLTGIQVGTVLGLPLSTWIMIRFGWPTIFYAYAAVGFVWVLVWWRTAFDRPEEHPRISAAELALLRGAGEAARPTPAEHGTAWRTLLRSPAVWALLLSTCCTNWIFFLFLTWLPTYLVKSQGFSLKAMGVFAMLPYLAAIVSGNGAGALADRLLARGYSPTRVRKAFFASGMLAAAVLLDSLSTPHSQTTLIALMTATHAAFAVGASTVLMNSIDLAPAHAGTLTGLQGLAGNLAGGVSPIVAGYIVTSSGDWNLVFYVAAGVALAGAVIFTALGSGKPIALRGDSRLR
jgi:ACS family sodium-dependent inorganic phosphate cotransporter